jgi:hypothetical protein
VAAWLVPGPTQGAESTDRCMTLVPSNIWHSPHVSSLADGGSCSAPTSSASSPTAPPRSGSSEPYSPSTRRMDRRPPPRGWLEGTRGLDRSARGSGWAPAATPPAPGTGQVQTDRADSLTEEQTTGLRHHCRPGRIDLWTWVVPVTPASAGRYSQPARLCLEASHMQRDDVPSWTDGMRCVLEERYALVICVERPITWANLCDRAAWRRRSHRILSVRSMAPACGCRLT